MAAVVPISHFSVLGRKTAPIVLAALGMTLLVRLAGLTSDGAPAQTLPRPQRAADAALLRHQPAARATMAALEGVDRRACVMVLAGSGKLSVGFEAPKRDFTVSLSACDLYNASREADSTELVSGVTLSARNIFLSGTYVLAPGAIMSASRYLATHTSPAANPYARLAVPSYTRCTRINYRLDRRQTETISPGVYCGGIEVAGGATLILDPGAYVLEQGNFSINSNAIVKATGVTIILTSRNGSNYGTVDIRRGSTIALSAPVEGAVAGIPGIGIWVDQRAPAAGAILDGGNSQNINGAIYMPTRQVIYSGGSPSGIRCSQLVALTVAFTGNSYFRHDCAGAGVSDPASPALLH